MGLRLATPLGGDRPEPDFKFLSLKIWLGSQDPSGDVESDMLSLYSPQGDVRSDPPLGPPGKEEGRPVCEVFGYQSLRRPK